jgi:Ca2+-binding EF-hand superfamily protein
MKGRYIIFSALVVAAGSAGFAYAEGQSTESQTTESQMFKTLDQDQNGTISKEEAQKQQQLSQNWSQYDTNHDDQIDTSEFSAFEAQMKEPAESTK